nr:protein phosphatase Slingshot homolog 2 [Pogona vitticeps]
MTARGIVRSVPEAAGPARTFLPSGLLGDGSSSREEKRGAEGLLEYNPHQAPASMESVGLMGLIVCQSLEATFMEADSGEDDCRFQPRSISESFLTVKGAALFLPRGNGSSTPRISHRRNKHAGDLQQHLQAMFMLLRPEDNIRLAVRLESTYQNRTRYMVVVSTNGRQDTEESIVLGMDFSSNDRVLEAGLPPEPCPPDGLASERFLPSFSQRALERLKLDPLEPGAAGREDSGLLHKHKAVAFPPSQPAWLGSSVCTMGLVLPLWSDALIHLDGDGGFSVSTDNRIHIFKPVSVQAMWSALQSLHKACEVARIHNYYPGSLFLTWVSYYESHINSDQSSVNEWNAMQDVQSHRPDSPALFTDVPTERERTERLIKTKLREIMMQKDLENITSKEIRTELEMQMACNLREFKEFIDNEMIVILGQMDSPTQIFEHVFLGSEWNASNLEDLQNRGVRYILNVTREIDNFFPGVFEYHNIRVYDEEATDLLAYWNDTYKFISKAKKNGSKCLVHCKMGVSRSASTVIAYAMKEYGWNLDRAYDHVKKRRTVTKPNPSFMRQLEEYQGILLASKQRHNKLWRSHSDSDLSDHHEPMGKSGMEVSKKEITTSADRISGNKASHCHPLSGSPGLPTSTPKEHLCHSSPGALGNLCNPDKAIQREIAPRDYRTEQLEDELNLNNLNGGPPGCPLDETGFPLDNGSAVADALRRRPSEEALGVPPASFPDLTVEDLEKDALLKPGDGSVHLVPMEELESCLRDASGRPSPSPPPSAPRPEEADFGADRIDFFSALEMFVELSQDSRPRACSHSRAEEQGGGGSSGSSSGSRNSLSKGTVLELSPSDPPSTEDAPRNSSARNSPLASEESSLEEEQLKLSEPDRSGGLTRSHSENAVSVKEIVTEIESIHQGAGQGPVRTDALNNPILAPKRNTVHELPAESVWTWENKLGKTEPNEGGRSVLKENPKEPLKPDPDVAVILQEPTEADEAGELPEDLAESPGNPRPKWCPGSVRRATLEFEERLRQEQEAPHASPIATLPLRKNSRHEPSSPELPAKGRTEDPSHELVRVSTEKEPSRAGSTETGNGPDPLAKKPSSPSGDDSPSVDLTGSADEHRTAMSAENREKIPRPGHRPHLLLPKRIEIIEYTHTVRSPALSGAGGAPEGFEDTLAVAVDENCNATGRSESPSGPPDSRRSSQSIFSLGSPDEEEKATIAGTSAHPGASGSAGRARPSPPPGSDGQLLFRLEGVTQSSSSSDPEPALLGGGYAGNGRFAFEERGGLLRRRSEGTLTHWNREDLDVPETLGGTGAERPPETPAPSSLSRGLLHSSSSDSLRGSSGASSVVKRRAQEFDARIRQAGLTTPSLMKRSASLAKLDCLDLSKEDLSGRQAAAAPGTEPASLESLRTLFAPREPGARGLASLESLRTLFAPGEPGARGPPAPPTLALDPTISSPLLRVPQPTAHLVEQLKLTECIALSRPVERPPAQYARDFNSARQLLEATLTSAQAAGLPRSAAPDGPQWLALLPRYQHSRTRPPRRLRKTNDRKRTTNPLYNTM